MTTKPFHRVYLAPWSPRREAVGLMGAFVIFLMGMPAHSELMMESAKRLVSQLIQLMLVFLGLATPALKTSGVTALPKVIAPHASVRTVHPFHPLVKTTVAPDQNFMFLQIEPNLHPFTYVFTGIATLKGQPCANASVLVRLISGDNTATQGAVTEADGSYSVKVTIKALDHSRVDWTVDAYTPDFNAVEVSGRRIVQVEEEKDAEPTIVNNPVEFVLTLAK